jgi:ATP-dependent RNA helicase RhlE
LAILAFKHGDVRILLATEVAARGLDIDDVKTIIVYDFPRTIEQ